MTESSQDKKAAATRTLALRVRGLTLAYGERPKTPAVTGVDIEVRAGEVVALVGQSGAGKSSVLLAILVAAGLRHPNLVIKQGSIEVAGRRLDPLRPPKRYLGRVVSHMGQDPYSAFDAFYTIGFQLRESYRASACSTDESLSRQSVRHAVLESLRKVGFKYPEGISRLYPHQLSGGMLQRAQLASAIAHRPTLLLADEPTSALDVHLRMEVGRLLCGVARDMGVAVLVATHDIRTASKISDRIGVMLGGRLVEAGPASRILAEGVHPYTRRLMEAGFEISVRKEPDDSRPPRATSMEV